jgi:hypothetical protein
MRSFSTWFPAGVIGRGLELPMNCRPGRSCIELRRYHLTRISLYVFVAGAPRSVVHCSQPGLEIPRCGLPVALSNLYNVLPFALSRDGSTNVTLLRKLHNNTQQCYVLYEINTLLCAMLLHAPPLLLEVGVRISNTVYFLCTCSYNGLPFSFSNPSLL